MYSDQSVLSPKEAALWRVGRNLHCFQSVEALLKSLLPATKISGTAQEIESQIVQNNKALKKASLGKLMDTYSRQVLSPHQQTLEPPSRSEILFAVTHSIEATPEVLKQMRSECKQLTRERNRLVHSTLLAYNIESQEGCAALSEYLDEQHARVRVLLEQLMRQARSRLFAAKAFEQVLESGEFERLFAESISDDKSPSSD